MAECAGCGTGYTTADWIEAIVPAAFWLEISPTGNDGGLLCFRCMRIAFEKLGYGQNGKPPVPFRIYYPGGSMRSELYPGFDGDAPEAANARRYWDRFKRG